MVVFSGGTVNVVVAVDVVILADDSIVVGVVVGNVVVVVDSAAVVCISVVLFAVDVGATAAEKTVVAEVGEFVSRSPSGIVELSDVRFLMCPSSAEVSDTADGDSAAVCIVVLAAGA